MYDPNLPRWITASIREYLTLANNAANIANGTNYPLYFNNSKGDKVWAELRLDGPRIENYEFSSWKIDVTIDILITAFIGGDDLLMPKLTGIYGSALDSDICCYKYGNLPQDDGSIFGRLQMYPSRERKIDIINWGVIAADSHFKRSTVEGNYTMWFDGIGI